MSDATIWSIILESSILEASFDNYNMFIVQATDVAFTTPFKYRPQMLHSQHLSFSL